jgi:hypothetical protein
MDDRLLEIYKKYFSSRATAVSAKGNAGQKILVSINNQRTRATCGNDINGEAIALQTDDGDWYLFNSKTPQPSKTFRSKQIEYRKTRNNVISPSQSTLKVLFSRREEGKLKFFIGGDRESPSLVYEIEDSSNSLYANGYITSTGSEEEEYLACLTFFDSGKIVFVNSGQISEIDKQGDAYTFCGYDTFHSTTTPSYPSLPTEPSTDILTNYYTYQQQQSSNTGSQSITISVNNGFLIERNYLNFVPNQVSQLTEKISRDIPETPGTYIRTDKTSVLGSCLLRKWQDSWFVSEIDTSFQTVFTGLIFTTITTNFTNNSNYFWINQGAKIQLKSGTYLNLVIESYDPISISAGITLNLQTRVHADYDIFDDSDLINLVGQEFLFATYIDSDTENINLSKGIAASITVGAPYNAPFTGEVRDVAIAYQITEVTIIPNYTSFGIGQFYLNNGTFLSYLRSSIYAYLDFADFMQQSKASDTFYDGSDASPNSFVKPLTIKRNESIKDSTVYRHYVEAEKDTAILEKWEISTSDGSIKYTETIRINIFQVPGGFTNILSSSYFEV